MHPSEIIKKAIEHLEISRLELQAKLPDLDRYEKEYLGIIDKLIAMMGKALHAHWFMMRNADQWDARDRWCVDILEIAETLVKDEE